MIVFLKISILDSLFIKFLENLTVDSKILVLNINIKAN